MKKTYLMFLVLGMINLSFGQQKSTGIVSLGSAMTVKLDMDSSTSKLTMTLTGPSTRWFAVGFNSTGTTMSSNSDCVVMNSATTLNDYKSLGGHNTPVLDPTQNWTISPGGNTVSGTTRTVIATRLLSTGDANDFTFDYAALSAVKLIWASGVSASYSFSGDHGGNRGAATGTFSVLGIDDFTSFEKINVYPNPSNGIFNISKNKIIQVSKIRIFDTSAQLLKEIDLNLNDQNDSVNLSELSKGTYFMEISNNIDKVVKKIEIN